MNDDENGVGDFQPEGEALQENTGIPDDMEIPAQGEETPVPEEGDESSS